MEAQERGPARAAHLQDRRRGAQGEAGRSHCLAAGMRGKGVECGAGKWSVLKVRPVRRTAWLLECVRMVLSVGAGNRGGGGGGGGRLGGGGVWGWGSTGGAARLVCA